MPSHISLIDGWFPTSVQIAVLLTAVLAFWRRGRRWWRVCLPLAAGVGGLVALGLRFYSISQGMSAAPLPWILWVWCGLGAAAVVVGAVGWTYGRHWQQVSAVACVLLSLLAAAHVLNQWTGYVSTARQAYETAVDAPLPGEVPLSALEDMHRDPPRSGVLVRVNAPSVASGMKHRPEVVYLPPAWFAGPHPPQLPVLVLIGGAFNTPADWVRSGHADVVADRYAAAHDGFAPVLVLADVSGSMGTDTECVDGPRGNSATYATQDLPQYIQATFGTYPGSSGWGIAGWSMGGTCAITLTTAHPEVYSTFLDIAGDLAPNAGNERETLARLFAGDVAARDRYDPATAMRTHSPLDYAGVTGRFVEGKPVGGTEGLAELTQEQAQRSQAPGEVLCPQARAAGIDCDVVTTDLPHQWGLAEAQFEEQFGWLSNRLFANLS
ncbi:alpha/beta hydrolase [Corynebacterium heidelbergense]|nr:alpha/beta hydrolase-fold protein [Corynebacterium heidelbergense]